MPPASAWHTSSCHIIHPEGPTASTLANLKSFTTSQIASHSKLLQISISFLPMGHGKHNISILTWSWIQVRLIFWNPAQIRAVSNNWGSPRSLGMYLVWSWESVWQSHSDQCLIGYSFLLKMYFRTNHFCMHLWPENSVFTMSKMSITCDGGTCIQSSCSVRQVCWDLATGSRLGAWTSAWQKIAFLSSSEVSQTSLLCTEGIAWDAEGCCCC